MSDGWTVNDEYTHGYDTALADLKPELDRLRADNKEQDKRILDWGDKYADLSNETDRLRAENDRMKATLSNPELTWADNTRLRAENERLRDVLQESLELHEWKCRADTPDWDGSATPDSTIGKLRAFLPTRAPNPQETER